MQEFDSRIPFGIQAIMAMVEKELATHNKPNIQVSIAIYLSSPDTSGKFVTKRVMVYIDFVIRFICFALKQDGGQVPGWSAKPGTPQKEAP